MWQYFPDMGHTWGIADHDTQLNALGFIWKNWDGQRVAVGDYSRTLSTVVDKNSPWTAVAEGTPLPPHVTATVDHGTYERGEEKSGLFQRPERLGKSPRDSTTSQR